MARILSASARDMMKDARLTIYKMSRLNRDKMLGSFKGIKNKGK